MSLINALIRYSYQSKAVGKSRLRITSRTSTKSTQKKAEEASSMSFSLVVVNKSFQLINVCLQQSIASKVLSCLMAKSNKTFATFRLYLGLFELQKRSFSLKLFGINNILIIIPSVFIVFGAFLPL